MKHKKSVASLISHIETTLSAVYDNAILREQYAWWILEAITHNDKATLIALETIELYEDEQKQLESWLDKMVQEHMPLQYLLGSVPFINLDILVEPPVLIPRPETEELTAWLIEQLKKMPKVELTILDMCTGSGCIALALAKAFPHAKIFATDISDKAIALAKKNAEHNEIHNVTFIQSDLYNEIVTDSLFDLIVSNPPYISFDAFQELDTSVTTWEDKQALVAADDGTAIIEDIILDAPDYLRPNLLMKEHAIPQLIFEMDYTQGAVARDLLESNGFTSIEIHKDLEGKDRFVTARLQKE